MEIYTEKNHLFLRRPWTRHPLSSCWILWHFAIAIPNIDLNTLLGEFPSSSHMKHSLRLHFPYWKRNPRILAQPDSQPCFKAPRRRIHLPRSPVHRASWSISRSRPRSFRYLGDLWMCPNRGGDVGLQDTIGIKDRIHRIKDLKTECFQKLSTHKSNLVGGFNPSDKY